MAQQQPILNPSVPFSGPIFGGLSEGKTVLIQGQVQASVKRFAVNLLCQNGDIAFHFNPRFDEGRHVVVCNTQEKGRWGPEERTMNMPFQPNTFFEMIIVVKGNCYQVSVNGSHLLEYKHRVPFLQVQTLQVNGGVCLNCIRFTAAGVPPPYSPPAYDVVQATNAGAMFAQPNFFQPNFAQPNFAQPNFAQPNFVQPNFVQPNFAQPNFAKPSNSRRSRNRTQGYSGIILNNPPVPLHVAIPGNFTQFRKVMIVGNVPLNSNRFAVNLKNSLTSNIVLHINPRLKEGALVRNTCINGSWGAEERHVPSMPFSQGQAFHMEITNLKNNYQVSVNGLVVFEYTHRIPPGQVDQLEITGDVSLSCVQY